MRGVASLSNGVPCAARLASTRATARSFNHGCVDLRARRVDNEIQVPGHTQHSVRDPFGGISCGQTSQVEPTSVIKHVSESFPVCLSVPPHLASSHGHEMATESFNVAITGLWSAIVGRTSDFITGTLESTRTSRCSPLVGSRMSCVRPISQQMEHSSSPFPLFLLENFSHTR